MANKSVHIIGAGIGGLTAAYFLIKKKIPVTIWEKTKAGGLLSTIETSYGMVESAANSMINTPLLQDLLDDINLKSISANKQSKKRLVYKNNSLINIINAAPKLELIKAKLSAKKIIKNNVPNETETVQEWVSTNFTKTINDYIVEPMLQGIYGASTSNLSAKLVFNSFLNNPNSGDDFVLEENDQTPVKKEIVSFEKGMGEFTSCLLNFLMSQPGFRLVNKAYPHKLATNNNNVVIIATNIKTCGQLLNKLDTGLADKLLQQDLISLSTTTLFHSNEKEQHKAFGCLFPKNQGFKNLGVLFNNQIFSNRATKGVCSETWISNNCHLKTEEIIESIKYDRLKVYKDCKNNFHHTVTTKWPEALPLYNKELLATQLHPGWKQLEKNRIFVTGNYLSGIGLSKILNQSKVAASKATNNFKNTTNNLVANL